MTRCWCYTSHGCRQQVTRSVRIGAHVYRYCDNPKHEPVVQPFPPCEDDNIELEAS